MTDYAVEIRIKNAHILRLMKSAGFRSARQLAIASKVEQARVGQLLNLKISPINRRGDWRNYVKRIADALNCMPDDLFSDTQRLSFMQSNKHVIEIEEHEIEQFLESRQKELESPEDVIVKRDITKGIRTALSKLNSKERDVIIMKFGLNDEEPLTFEQISEKIGLSAGRVQQIEAKAMRRLRRPTRIKPILEAMR